MLSSFRGEDIVARWSGDEFVVGLYGATKEQAVNRVAEVLEALRQEEFPGPDGKRFIITFSAGVAQYPRDGGKLQTVYQAAEQALVQAKDTGGNRVLPAESQTDRDPSGYTVDVALVDDDELLTSLLSRALHTRGYRVQCFTDSQAAVTVLAGANPSLRARVVLVNIDSPSLDGAAVLQQLAQPQVLLLTTRSAAELRREARKLGAFDSVRKPFSIPVLLQHIRRVLHP